MLPAATLGVKYSMNIEIVKLQKQKSEEFTIWINGDGDFISNDFLELMTPLGISKNERVFSCFGPLEFIDEIQTESGQFTFHQELDEFPGTTIYSDSTELMNKILGLMLESGVYHVR